MNMQACFKMTDMQKMLLVSGVLLDLNFVLGLQTDLATIQPETIYMCVSVSGETDDLPEETL